MGTKTKQLEGRGQEAFVCISFLKVTNPPQKFIFYQHFLDGFRWGEKNMEKWRLAHFLGCENIYTIVYIFMYLYMYGICFTCLRGRTSIFQNPGRLDKLGVNSSNTQWPSGR